MFISCPTLPQSVLFYWNQLPGWLLRFLRIT